MHQPDIKELLDRYKLGKCTEEEQTLVESWYLNWETAPFDVSEQQLQADLLLVKLGLPKRRLNKWLYYQIAAAAIALITVGTAFYFFNYRNASLIENLASVDGNSIVPGSNKAILTLSDGSKVILDKEGHLSPIKQLGVKISKSADGRLVYINARNRKPVAIYNTITTPKGGQYEVTLADGTHVWLNADSKLRFPVVFTGTERSVEVTGEAYFEVAKDQQKPFKVKSDNQEITVLGTHFNVNAYSNESFSRTTLLEGSIRVTKGVVQTLLSPGQQVINEVSSPSLKVRNVTDVNESIAWKNGLFMFEQEPVSSIMNKISRWYNIAVEYQGDVKGRKYSGTISKFEEVTEVLKTMQLTGTIQFKIEGRRIIVMP